MLKYKSNAFYWVESVHHTNVPISERLFKKKFCIFYLGKFQTKKNFWDWLLLFSIISLRVIQVVCVTIVHLFVLLNSVPWYGCTIVCLTIHPLKAIWVVSDIWLLQISLLWISFQKYLQEYKLSSLWYKYQKVQLLCLMISSC